MNPNGRPVIGKQRKINMPEALHARAQAIAAREGVTVSDVYRRAVALGLVQLQLEPMDYVLTCASGMIALVSATSSEAAEAAWDAEVATGEAEPRFSSARKAYPSEVEACVFSGHDYRSKG